MDSQPRHKFRCPDFCCEPILRDLRLERKNELMIIIHDILQKEHDDPYSVCDGFLKKVDGIDSFLQEVILKNLCSALFNASASEAAVKLANQRLEDLKNEDFGTLMILGTMLDKSGQFQKAVEINQRAYDAAMDNSNHLQIAVSLVALATNNWNVQQPELSRQLFERAQREFQRFSPHENVKLPTADSHLLVNYHTQLGYFNRVINLNFRESSVCYSRALDVGQQTNTICQLQELELKMLSFHSKVNDGKPPVDELIYYQNVFDDIMDNFKHISAHGAEVIHSMAKLGYAYEKSENYETAVEIYEKLLSIARIFYGDENPKVARIASDIIFLKRKLNQSPSFKLVQLFHASLRGCNYKNDRSKMELYVRELTDALSNFALYNKMQGNLTAAKDKFKVAIEIDSKVFGEKNFRGAKLKLKLSKVYRLSGKLDLAEELLRESKTMLEMFRKKRQPHD